MNFRIFLPDLDEGESSIPPSSHDAGITFGPGITEPTDPRTDGIPYPLKPSHEITVLPKHDSPLYIMPATSDEEPKRPDLQRAIAAGILETVFGGGRWIN